MEDAERLNAARRYLHEGRINDGIKECTELTNIGSAEAPDYLGVLYSAGIGVPEDKDKAENYFRISHDRGYSMGTYHLAGAYLRDSKIGEALELFKSIAGVNPSAAYWAFRCLESFDSNNSREDAEKFLKLASDMGHVQANRIIADRTIAGKYGLIKIPYGLYLYGKMIVLAHKSIIKEERFKYIDSLGRIKSSQSKNH